MYVLLSGPLLWKALIHFICWLLFMCVFIYLYVYFPYKFIKNISTSVSSALTFDLHCHCLAGRCHSSSLRTHNPCDPNLTRPSRDHCHHSCTRVTGLFFFFPSCFHSTHLSDAPLDLERLQRESHTVSLYLWCALVPQKQLCKWSVWYMFAEGLSLCWFVMPLYCIFCSMLCCVWTQAVLLISYKCQSNTVSACQE